MNRFAWMAALLIVITAGFGCGKGDQTRAPEGSTATDTSGGPASGHAEGIVPGSHEDWCDEHQVQETMCTRCDPSLIPAFKASGDWDETHGLPKSQCLKCDPTLKIVRPPKA